MQILQAPEHDLNPVAAFVAALVVLDRLSTRLPPRNTSLYAFVFQRFSEPVSVIAPVGQQPVRRRQIVQEGSRSRVVADLAFGHEEPDRTAIGIGDGVQLRVHAALGSADQTAPLAACPPPSSTAGWSPCDAP